MLLTLDIETLPTSDEALIAQFAQEITPPANYKKPESIAAWLAENRDSLLKERIAKTSLDGLYGRLACICYAFDDGEVFSVSAITADDEKPMLQKFYAYLSRTRACASGIGSFTIIGHNIVGFDLPFLKHRSIIHGVKPVQRILEAMHARPWDSCIADTMLMWSSDREKRVSMDKLCKAFGLEGKGDIDGSMVAGTWATDPRKVIEYCRGDIERTRAIYKRLVWAGQT